MPQRGGMPSEAKAPGNAGDMQTEGGYSGRLRCLIKARALSAGLSFCGTRFKRSESQLPQEYICQAALSGNGLSRTNDKVPNTQEPDVSREASPVLKQRWRGRPLHRL